MGHGEGSCCELCFTCKPLFWTVLLFHSWDLPFKGVMGQGEGFIVQELCESQSGRPGLSVLTSLLVSVDVKLY